MIERLSENHTAVDHEHLSGDVCGQVGRQKQHGAGNVLGAAKPPKGNRL